MSDSKALARWERESVMDNEYRSYMANGHFRTCRLCGKDYRVQYLVYDNGLCPPCEEERYHERLSGKANRNIND